MPGATPERPYHVHEVVDLALAVEDVLKEKGVEVTEEVLDALEGVLVLAKVATVDAQNVEGALRAAGRTITVPAKESRELVAVSDRNFQPETVEIEPHNIVSIKGFKSRRRRVQPQSQA